MRAQRIGERFVSDGVVMPWQVEAALHWQERFGGRLGEILVEARFATAEAVYRVVAEMLGVRFVRLRGRRIDRELAAHIPRWFVRRHRVLPIQLLSCDARHTLIVASADPANDDVAQSIRVYTKTDVRMVLATPADLERALVELGLVAPKRATQSSQAW